MVNIPLFGNYLLRNVLLIGLKIKSTNLILKIY